MNHREKEEAVKIIDAKLQEAWKLVQDCVKLADHSGCCFTLPWGGEGDETRGMGASYVPDKASDEMKRAFCNESWSGEPSPGWQPSAGQC